MNGHYGSRFHACIVCNRRYSLGSLLQVSMERAYFFGDHRQIIRVVLHRAAKCVHTEISIHFAMFSPALVLILSFITVNPEVGWLVIGDVVSTISISRFCLIMPSVSPIIITRLFSHSKALVKR